MSNDFTSSPALVDSSRVTAGQTIRTTEVARLADLQNYCFAVGGTHNVISQTFDDSCFRQDSTSFVEMCGWYIPKLSRSHNELKIRLSAFCGSSGAQIMLKLTFPISGNTYTDTITVTDTARYGGVFDVATITTLLSETESVGLLTLSVKATATHEIEVLGIQANWSPLTSPITAGVHYIGSNEFIPQGATRQAADEPLSSRFGVETLRNMSTLRTRGRVLLNWSGVRNASSSSALNIAANPPIGLGHGDQYYMFSEVALFSGMNELDLTINLFANVASLSGGQTITVEIFSHRLTFSSNGWSSYSLTLIRDELTRSNEFGLSMYRVGVEVSSVNADSLLSMFNPIASTPYITGLSIIGV